MPNLINKFLKLVGLSKAVSVTLVARVWTVFSGLGTLFFITRYLSPELQGYYYTFNSLISLQVFVELGLNFAIIQFASHEMAKLSWTIDGKIAGDMESKRRLQSLMQFAFTWYGAASLLVIILLLPAGLVFFNLTASQNNQTQPGLAWGIVVFFTSIVLILNAALALLEGCGKIAEVALLRLTQILITSIAVWVALANHAGLYALAVGASLMSLTGTIAVYMRYRVFFRDLWKFKSDLPGIHWKHELWPFQWRIAVSWASGYFVFQLFNPFLFATHGPIVAGQMGMSLQIIFAMNGMAMIWITTKAPIFGKYIAENNIIALDSTFKTALMQSFILLLIGILIFLIAIFIAKQNNQHYVERLLPLPSLFVLCLACLANHIVYAEAAYLRAHKQEPFMILSVASGIATLVLAGVLIQPYGYVGAVAAYSFGAIFVGLIGGSSIFYFKRKSWSN